jgi:dTDP-4-dehydrorhamnose reductase
MSDKTVVVIGADGTIGSALVCRLNEAGMDVWQTTRRRDCPGKHHLDLSDSREDWNLPISGTFAYLLAGQTSTAWCQANRDQARAINVDGTVSLAKELIDRGIRVIFVSSSLVFDGCLPATKADHPKSPRTEYGRQKAEAEDRLLEQLSV